MPPVRSISISDNSISIVDINGTKTLTGATIPGGQNTVALAEAWLNTTWIAANISGYQVRFHVESLSPLRVTVLTINSGLAIPSNWWT